MKNLKAQIGVDGIFLLVLLFAVAIGLMLWATIWNGFVATPQFQSISQATPQGKAIVASSTQAQNILANFLIFLYLGMCIATLISAAFTTSHPVFLVLGFVIMPLEILFSFIFHDVFFVFISNSAIAGAASAYPSIISLFTYLPLITFIVALISLIITFTKP